MSSVTIEPRLRKLFVDHLGITDDDVKPHASMVDDLGCDSLDVIEVVMAIEDEYGIRISDDEANRIVTVQDAALLIDRLIAAEAVPNG